MTGAMLIRPAPATTVEALAYQLRGGVEVLREESALPRVAALDEKQAMDLANRLCKERFGKCEIGKPFFNVPAWTEFEIKTFIKIWRLSHGCS
jgi:hypothetical protein